MRHAVVVKETIVRPEHNFKLKRDDWELAVFDASHRFSVAGYHQPKAVFDDLQAAFDYATTHPRCCVYAFTESGRQIVLDRGLWSKWMERYRGRVA